MVQTISKVQLDGVKLFRRGKVRDVFDLGEHLLIVSTDRISCFDVVLPNTIPLKGQVLTQLSLFWFELTKDLVQNHLVSANIDEFPASLKIYQDQLQGRSMIVKKAELIPFECVVRGYLSGSAWKEYKQNSSVCGISLPSGLRESSPFVEPLFTPSTKAHEGHDMNVSQDYMAQQIGKELTKDLQSLSVNLYLKACAHAYSKGIIIADTKFEFGLFDNRVILIDEILTPDSSRFWPKAGYKEGQPQPSFDKQFVRDYLETLDWDKTPPAPSLPQEVIDETSRKYLEIYKLLTGQVLAVR